MNSSRITVVAIFLFTFLSVVHAQEAEPAPDAWERPIYRLILKCDATKVDNDALKTALSGLETVERVDLKPHADGLEAWVTRDQKSEIKKRDFQKALKGTDTKLQELAERWVGTDEVLLPVAISRADLDKLSPEDFYTTGRTMLYRVTTTIDGKVTSSGYERRVFDDFMSKQGNSANYHSRLIVMDADRKLVRVENTGANSSMSNKEGKTEDVETTLGKFACRRTDYDHSITDIADDGNITTTNHPASSWTLDRLNLPIKRTIDEKLPDGKVKTTVTELIEVG